MANMSKRSPGGGMMRCIKQGRKREIVSRHVKTVEQHKPWLTTEKTKRMLRKQ